MKHKQTLVVFTDGGSRGNPGSAAYGFVVYDKDNNLLYEEGKKIGITTNNVAEYRGVIEALSWIAKNANGVEKINCFMDSELVASQLSGRYKVKNENMRNLFFTVKTLEQNITATITYTSIPREKNTEADALVNLALDDK